jgi:Ca-activated chloride channel family protein
MKMGVFRFEHPDILYALLLIPLLMVIFWWMLRWRKKGLESYGEPRIVGLLLIDVSKNRLVVKFILLVLAFIFLVIGLSNPQVGSRLVEAERKGIDVVVALDVSNSMLAEDIKPNRLERAKQAISKLVDKMGNDRIGIVVFAGKAYVQLPITTDYSAAKLFLTTVTTKDVPTQGTAIGDAIELAITSFDDDTHSRAIIVITDGENHEDDAIEAAENAASKGIRVYTIGMGLSKGAPIPVYDRYNRRTGYKKNRQGSTVITKLNESALQQIATAGKGIYVRANNTQTGLRKIFNDISKLEKTKFDSKIFSDYESRFQYFIALSLVFLLIELMVFEKKPKWSKKVDLFNKKSWMYK